MEIERKYLILKLPENLKDYPHRRIEQGYLSVNPVVRVRMDGNSFYLTYKGEGMMVREEYNLPLTKESYEHLLAKADGNIITKERYNIPFTCVHTDGATREHMIELDLFDGIFSGMKLAEVEFDSETLANTFCPPDWFGEDVTFSHKYHNSYLSSVSPQCKATTCQE